MKHYFQCLRVEMTDENAKFFFDSVKPLVRQTRFDEMEFTEVNSEIMGMILELLEGKSIKRVECRRDRKGLSQSQLLVNMYLII